MYHNKITDAEQSSLKIQMENDSIRNMSRHLETNNEGIYQQLSNHDAQNVPKKPILTPLEVPIPRKRNVKTGKF